jgi:uncharacterized YigZ family protein
MSMPGDIFLTIAKPGSSTFRDKASRFLGFALPVSTEEQAKETLANYRKKYHDANHHCFAYCLGPSQELYRVSDDGEPSGSAGRPILGQLKSRSVTDTLVIVARYFGGTKLGIPGLINAYRQTASEALDNAGIIEKTIMETLTVSFPYERMNDVMRIQKEEELIIIEQIFDSQCRISLSVRQSRTSQVIQKLGRFRDISL